MTITKNFALPPEVVRELGYILNDGQRAGWMDRVSELLGVTSRTVEAWARGDRVCNGPPAVLMAYLTRMIVDGTYSEISLDEVNQIIGNHGKKAPLDLSLPEVRAKVRSLIRLHSSIKKVAEDLSINRSALSRWLSGENALGFDSISKVLDHIGLNRDIEAQYSQKWFVSLDWERSHETTKDIQNATRIFFSKPPKCLIAQVGKLDGRVSTIHVNLSCRKTDVVVEVRMPTRLARHSEGLSWFVSSFDHVDLFTFYCPLDVETHLKGGGDPVRRLDAG